MGQRRVKHIIAVILAGLGLFLIRAPLGVPVSKTIQGGLIVPHHLLVKEWMERFYEEQSLRYSISIERIILLSPNHFGYGYNWIQSTDLPTSVAKLDGRGISRLSLGGVVSIEPTHFYREHGITAEFPYLERFFWGATIIPITLKEGTPQAELDALVEALIELQKRDVQKTLIIASIDFTHVEEESYALENDNRTIQLLQSVSVDGPPTLDTLRALAATANPAPLDGAVAMDSPETLYVLLQLMHHAQKPEFTLWDRTSSASLIPGLPPQDNTSHIFGSFGGGRYPESPQLTDTLTPRRPRPPRLSLGSLGKGLCFEDCFGIII